MRSPRSRLDVQSFEIAPFTALIGKLEKESIECVSVTTFSMRDPDWIVKWRELQWELTQDVPTTAPPRNNPWNFTRRYLMPRGLSQLAALSHLIKAR